MPGSSTSPSRSHRRDQSASQGGARSCPVCHGTGFEVSTTPEDGISRARRCECSGKDRLEQRLKASRVPRRYHDCSFDSFAELNPSLTLAKTRVIRFVEEYPMRESGIVLLGRCGVGKTHLAAAALLGLTQEKGADGLFYDFRDLLKEIQASYNPVSGTTERGILQPIFGVDVLVLDDLGATKMTDWVRDTLSHIINNRYNESRLTIFTSNLEDVESAAPSEERLRDRPTLKDQIGDPLHSRLYEMCEIIRLEGDDFRLTAKHAGIRHGRRPGRPR